MREDKDTSGASAEERVLNTFIQKHIENLAWLEENSENWSKAIGLAAYHLVEFGCYDQTVIFQKLRHFTTCYCCIRISQKRYANLCNENDISIDIKLS